MAAPDWRELPPEPRQAAAAGRALVLSLLLPWYQTSSPAVVRARPTTIEDSLSAFEAFSFVEAAVLLVAGGVLYLVRARAERKAFHLPGGDGWVISAAGAWAMFLLVWRLFDKPGVDGAAVGVEWGLFVALFCAGALIAAGQRVRAAHRPEPPNPADDPTWEMPGRHRPERPDRVPVDPAAVTEALAERPPAWEGEPPEPPRRSRPPEARRALEAPAEPDNSGRLF